METTIEQASLDQLTYEIAFTELETILSRLERSDLPLEEALALYERGATLAAHCTRKLEEADLRVRQWMPSGETKPFDGWQDK